MPICTGIYAAGLPSPEVCLALTIFACGVACTSAVLIIAAFIGRGGD
jgi:hypothetical protein